MPTLNEQVSDSLPHPLGAENTAGAKVAGANVHEHALHEAILTMDDASGLPAGIAKAKREIEKADAARTAADAKLQSAISRQQAYESALRELAERNSRLAGQVARLANAQATIANAATTLKGLLLQEHNTGPGPVIAMLNELSLDREVVAVFPVVIEADRAEVAALQARVDKAKAECEID